MRLTDFSNVCQKKEYHIIPIQIAELIGKQFFILKRYSNGNLKYYPIYFYKNHHEFLNFVLLS